MNNKIHRCGHCGNPVDKKGKPLEGKDRRKAIRVLSDYGDDHTELHHGDCCPPEQERQYRRVTRDMAIDAGMPELEGTYVLW